MVKLNSLREALGLPPVTPDWELPSFGAAAAQLSAVPPARWRPAFARLLAQELQPHLSGLSELLGDLNSVVGRSPAEHHIVQWLAEVTGGRATLRSSWGDVVAQQGSPGAARMAQRLIYEGRLVGSLELEASAHWQPLVQLVAEQARLARLQAAAAGAARRRVGERQFEALLAGDHSGMPESGPCVLAALRLDRPMPRAGRAREAYIHRLDVLCSVGEGYFHRRHLTCLTTVRGDKALWLWQSRDAEREARGLHTALLNATEEGLRLGISGTQPSSREVNAALRQALQALDEVRAPRGMVSFQRLDPLQALLDSEALHALSEQVRGRLRAEDEGGKLEDTLRQYLVHRGSLAELAGLLNLHVNTLRYRLRRIEEVLGGELSEPAFVARLYLAFHAAGQPRVEKRAKEDVC
ncbi:CdaR family transcriptional regulator [Deinococcus sp. YIM 77859]|uniref:PucR family transcriptional regulator n=1 Tax=Deinococcus sp. YIM 77859 TaxID=1540221 RepID=UPI00068AA05B|nr:PucR family transcriptional regulator [Deinococcus sp. YIM 77859]